MGTRSLRPKSEGLVDHHPSREPAALRLLSADSPEEILPILLEEIVLLGFPRAFVLEVDFGSGKIKSTSSLNCGKKYLARFNTSLRASEDPVVGVIQTVKPAVLPGDSSKRTPLYACPMIYRSRSSCWEAKGKLRKKCLAVQNFQSSHRLQVQEQVCAVCGIRGYINVILTELHKKTTALQLRQILTLVDLGNRHLARLYKTKHYYERMRDMDVTISRMGTVMQSMADPVILTDNQHRVIIQNKAAERFFRLPEVISESGRRSVQMNSLLFSAALSSMVVSGSDASRDYTLVDVMNGKEVLFEAVCAPTSTEDGTRSGIVTVMRDVTDLRRADREVRDNLERLRAAEEVVRQDRDRLNLVIENVGDPIIVADNSAKIVLLDPLAKQLFGLANEYRDPQIVKNQAKLDAYLTAFTFSFVDKENRSIHLHHPGNRSEIEYAARSGKIYDARGQAVYTVTVLRDFSTWKKLEQLQVERRMLEMEKFAATGRLAGTIAHEINNPMEAIKNAIYLLKGKVDEPSLPVYEILRNETDRVTRIVRQMLGLYRNTAQLGSFDVNSVLEDTLALFARPLSKAGIIVDKRLGEVPSIKGSADQFRQLFSNLVVNARDSMQEGRKLTVRTKHLRAPDGIHGWVTITIADQGSGIPQELQPSMFEPFVTTKGEKGTGLGLWIVKGIVENHAGRIQVRSTIGKGTIFKVAFPMTPIEVEKS
jgi:signal transduction histidine kinase